MKIPAYALLLCLAAAGCDQAADTGSQADDNTYGDGSVSGADRGNDSSGGQGPGAPE